MNSFRGSNYLLKLKDTYILSTNYKDHFYGFYTFWLY
jgi:hypothetical protein